MRIIFLDIDGVLNGHEYSKEAESCSISAACVSQLNRVLAATGARIVLSSAWRYMVHGGAMTLRGFEYMLRTHGVHAKDRIVGLTIPDEQAKDRDTQICAWLASNSGIESFVVIDDMHIGISGRCVRTEEKTGLTEHSADQAISILLGDAA